MNLARKGTGDSIHSGQVLAEILGPVGHLQFFEYSDVEVPSLSLDGY